MRFLLVPIAFVFLSTSFATSWPDIYATRLDEPEYMYPETMVYFKTNEGKHYADFSATGYYKLNSTDPDDARVRISYELGHEPFDNWITRDHQGLGAYDTDLEEDEGDTFDGISELYDETYEYEGDPDDIFDDLWIRMIIQEKDGNDWVDKGHADADGVHYPLAISIGNRGVHCEDGTPDEVTIGYKLYCPEDCDLVRLRFQYKDDTGAWQTLKTLNRIGGSLPSSDLPWMKSSHTQQTIVAYTSTSPVESITTRILAEGANDPQGNPTVLDTSQEQSDECSTPSGGGM